MIELKMTIEFGSACKKMMLLGMTLLLTGLLSATLASAPEVYRSKFHQSPVRANPGDLLVWNYDTRHWICLAVKVPGGRFTPKQHKFRKDNPDVEVPVVYTKEHALIEVKMR